MTTSPRAQRTIGVDVGGTKTLAVLLEVPPEGAPTVLDRELVDSGAASSEVLRRIESSVQALLDRSDREVVGVGVGLAGFVDRAGVVHKAPNVPVDQAIEPIVERGPKLHKPGEEGYK